MLTYNAAATLYFVFVGIATGFSGILLWPAVFLHAVVTACLAWDQREANLEKT